MTGADGARLGDRPAASTDRRRALRSRPLVAAAAVVVTAAGLLVHAAVPATVGDFAGDALYALLVFLVAAFLLPRAPTLLPAGLALAFCGLIEAWQLTGTPAALVESFPPARLAVGTTFSAVDLLAYAVGVLTGAAADRPLLRR